MFEKAAWLNRFVSGLHNETLSFNDLQTHNHGDNVVVVAVMNHQTTFNDIDTSGQYRIGFVVVREGGRWKISSCHIGPLDAGAAVS